jgi:hypothetical protein
MSAGVLEDSVLIEREAGTDIGLRGVEVGRFPRWSGLGHA